MKCICGGNMYKSGGVYECAKCCATVLSSGELNERKRRNEIRKQKVEAYKRNMTPSQKQVADYLKKHPRVSIMYWH